jgi:hypothetical protein
MKRLICQSSVNQFRLPVAIILMSRRGGATYMFCHVLPKEALPSVGRAVARLAGTVAGATGIPGGETPLHRGREGVLPAPCLGVGRAARSHGRPTPERATAGKVESARLASSGGRAAGVAVSSSVAPEFVRPLTTWRRRSRRSSHSSACVRRRSRRAGKR